MKRLVILGLGVIALGVGLILGFHVIESFLYFIIAGKIPFTNLFVPPTIMFLLWILVIPCSIIACKASNKTFWQIIETIGKHHQRYLNRQVRWIVRQTHSDLTLLITTVLLQIANELPKNSTVASNLELRRRFVALPS